MGNVRGALPPTRECQGALPPTKLLGKETEGLDIKRDRVLTLKETESLNTKRDQESEH